ncbi:hypothetical protein B9T39_01985 [Alloscardovia macacae]|uniref:Uncharacterized protein n=1 Tax=Alloscardovia macacae TaxID=1160091 RepID=A0A1Y2SZK8_9BIFI|nr:hypothetical protein [Alloscardovia macacae]OTA29872.1 hypothetical protein B9T39_01985 [Alloscardovia macacae]
MSDYVPANARALTLYHAAISPDGWQHLDEIASHANAYPELMNWVNDVQQLCRDEDMSVEQAVSMIGLPAEPPRAQRQAFIPLFRSTARQVGTMLMQYRISIAASFLTACLVAGGIVTYPRLRMQIENTAADAASRAQTMRQAEREKAAEKAARTELATVHNGEFIEENLKRALEARVDSLTHALYLTPSTRTQLFETLTMGIRSVYARELNAYLDELTARLSQQLSDAQSLTDAPDSAEKTQMLALASEWADKKVSEKNAADAQKAISRIQELTSIVRAQKDAADAAAAQAQQEAAAAAAAEQQAQQQAQARSSQTQQRKSTPSAPRVQQRSPQNGQTIPQQNAQQARPNWSVPAQTPEASLPDSLN